MNNDAKKDQNDRQETGSKLKGKVKDLDDKLENAIDSFEEKIDHTNK
jgi:hypothetical protein